MHSAHSKCHDLCAPTRKLSARAAVLRGRQQVFLRRRWYRRYPRPQQQRGRRWSRGGIEESRIKERSLGGTPPPPPVLPPASPHVCSSKPGSQYIDYTTSQPLSVSPFLSSSTYGSTYGLLGGIGATRSSPGGWTGTSGGLSGTELSSILGGGLLAAAPGSLDEEVTMLRDRIVQVARAAERAEGAKEHQARSYKTELKRMQARAFCHPHLRE